MFSIIIDYSSWTYVGSQQINNYHFKEAKNIEEGESSGCATGGEEVADMQWWTSMYPPNSGIFHNDNILIITYYWHQSLSSQALTYYHYHWIDNIAEADPGYDLVRSYGGWWNHGLQQYSGLYCDGGLGSLSWYRGSRLDTNNNPFGLSLVYCD